MICALFCLCAILYKFYIANDLDRSTAWYSLHYRTDFLLTGKNFAHHIHIYFMICVLHKMVFVSHVIILTKQLLIGDIFHLN